MKRIDFTFTPLNNKNIFVMKTLEKINTLPTFESMMEDFWNTDGFFNQPILSRNNYPNVNILDQDSKYEITVSAPGFKKEDFKVDMDNGFLSISAETSKESKEEKKNYLRREFSTSSFCRSFRLPDNITDEQIKANYQDGLLNISIAKVDNGGKNHKQIKID